jgi:hypothetical protein
MILLVVGLVAVLVVVFIAVMLSIRLGHGDEHDEPDLPSRGRGRRRADEDEHWLESDTRRAPATAARGMDSRGRRGEDPGYADRGRDYAGPPRRPARSPVPAAAQARGRYDTGPQRRSADGDFPLADHPSMDFGPVGARPSGGQPPVEFPAADYPVEFPAADYGAMDHPEDRPEPRRKAASANGKSRSRQRRKRNNDADWPTTEWDELSDEQYWAELSADKPLAAMAKPSRSASRSGAKAPVNGSAKRGAEPPTAREPRRARTLAPTRDAPGRNERTEAREPVTERLPVRTRQQPTAPGGRRDAGTPLAGAYPPGPRSARDTGPQARRDPLRDSGPWTRDTGSHPVQDTGPHASRDARPRPEQPRPSAAPNPVRDRDLAMLAGLASTPPPVPGALDDDPLTSPSFSLKADTAADSRSYGSSRKHARPSGHGAAPGHGNGNGTGSYPVGDYVGGGHAYQPASPAAPMEQWHSTPPGPSMGRHSVSYDPYQHAGPSASHGGYVGDPLGGYSPPAYEAPPYAEPASPAYQALPGPGMAAPRYANGHAQHAYPGQSPYPGGHPAGGYTNGYDAGYGGEPYAGGGYERYPSRG